MRSLRSLLILGGAGFIGSSLVRKLLAAEGVEQVFALDVFPEDHLPPRLTHLAKNPRFRYLYGDVLQKDNLCKTISQLDLDGIIHLAEAHPDQGANQERLLTTNVIGTSNALEAARLADVPLVYGSTDEVYGSVDAPDRFLENAVVKPGNPYAASKASAEMLCLAALRSTRQEVIITRSSQTYGAYQADHQQLSSLVQNAMLDQPLPLVGNGMQIRDWMHIDDHCAGLITAYQRGHSGEIYNFSGNCERTEIGIARNVLTVLEKPESLITQAPYIPGTDARRSADPTKVARHFGWYPRRDFKMHFSPAVREIASRFVTHA